MKEPQVIDAEFVEVIVEDPSLLSQAADLAEKVAKPLDRIGAENAATKCKMVAETARLVDRDLREIEPIARSIGEKVRRVVNLNPSRGILPR